MTSQSRCRCSNSSICRAELSNEPRHQRRNQLSHYIPATMNRPNWFAAPWLDLWDRKSMQFTSCFCSLSQEDLKQLVQPCSSLGHLKGPDHATCFSSIFILVCNTDTEHIFTSVSYFDNRFVLDHGSPYASTRPGAVVQHQDHRLGRTWPPNSRLSGSHVLH